jgi:hypothetical protein
MTNSETEYRLLLTGTIRLDIAIDAQSESETQELKAQILQTVNDQITVDCGKIEGAHDVCVDEVELEIGKPKYYEQ